MLFSFIGVSLLREVLAGLDTRHDTPPSQTSSPIFSHSPMKHLGWRTLRGTVGIVAGHLCRGQTNFLKSLFRFNSVYDPGKLLADHARPVHYAVPLPETEETPKRAAIYVHAARGRHDRALDRGTEQFVVETGARVFGAGK